jgi:prepilin-type N-terminal cleavage/methylation domain-containing protein
MTRGGFSLVEIIIAMAMLTIVMILLASMSLSVGRRATLNDLNTKRNLALSQQANRISVMPFAEVAALSSGTTQLLLGGFSFNRRLTVTQSATNRYTIRIVIAPITTEFRADSVTIDRTRPASGTPLCTTC